ncbi:1733_t:CDS:2 [Gigaspora margarita]|uniref:1733_t:CDS:1 n=1 Tax=Gigaspora margarita TaxID=4874 RepID=A0ABM8W1N3_GIGMA|nr:1733_t:CDS:2 [Gigaspora margarita]
MINGSLSTLVKSDTQKKVDRHWLLEILINKKHTGRSMKNISNKKNNKTQHKENLENLDLENKVVNHILLIWLKE